MTSNDKARTDTTANAAGNCSYVNPQKIRCGLKLGHLGDHEPDEQLVPPDPFCLQPHDPFTLAAIRCWIVTAHAHKVPPSKIQRAEESYRAIRRWQREHGTRLAD